MICWALEAEQGSRESRHPLLVGSFFEDPYFRGDRKLSLLLWLIPSPRAQNAPYVAVWRCDASGVVGLWRKWRCGVVAQVAKPISNERNSVTA